MPPGLLRALGSPDPGVRQQAFFEIVKPLEASGFPWTPSGAGESLDKPTKAALIGLLSRESKRYDAASSLTEGEINYWWEITAVVAALHDKDAIPALLDPSVVLNGADVSDQIATFGDAIVPHIKMLYATTQDPRYRYRLLEILFKLVKYAHVKAPENMALLKQTFLVESRSGDMPTRVIAINGLSFYADHEAVDRVKQVAESDSFKTVSNAGVVSYPVRNEAIRLLNNRVPH
jgi:hypothetical protein